MALHWDVTKVNEAYAWEGGKAPGDGETGTLDPIMHGLIWLTVSIGLRGITAANAEEFAARLEILQMIDGPMMNGPDGPFKITREDVLARVGLTVNVGDEPRAAWLKRVTSRDFYAADRAKKARAKARV